MLYPFEIILAYLSQNKYLFRSKLSKLDIVIKDELENKIQPE